MEFDSHHQYFYGLLSIFLSLSVFTIVVYRTSKQRGNNGTLPLTLNGTNIMKPSQSTPEKMSKDKQIGLLALALDNPPPPDGLAPDLNELLAWQQGKIPQPRADEIKSHIARDPEIYALWRQAREAQGVGQPAQTGLSRFKWPQWPRLPKGFAIGAYPLAIAAALLLVIGIPRIGHQPTLSSQIDEDYQVLAPLGLNSGQWLSGLGLHEKSLEMPTPNNPNLSELKLPINAGIRQGLQDLTGHSQAQ